MEWFHHNIFSKVHAHGVHIMQLYSFKVRMSVGLEDIDDLIQDLDQALQVCTLSSLFYIVV